MIYKHKLSRRLALIFDSSLALAVVLSAGCAGGDAKTGFGPATDTTVSAIVLTPEKPIAAIGESVRILAYGQSEVSDSEAVQLDWEASGGTVTPGGVFRADTVGDYTVTGRTRNEAQAEQSTTVRVQQGPAVATGCMNEPAGYTTISDQGFNDLPIPGPATDGAGWSARASDIFRLKVVSDPASPRSPSSVMDGLFPQGAKGGSAPFKMWRRFERNVTAVYMCMWHKLDRNFTNNGNSATKFGFFETPYHGNISMALNHYFNLTDYLGIRLQSRGGTLNRNVMSTYNMMRHLGEWHKIEWLVISNSINAGDGVARIWVDGQQVLDASDVRYFYPGQTPAFNGVTWNPTYGGGHNPVLYDMHQYIDHWYISAR